MSIIILTICCALALATVFHIDSTMAFTQIAVGQSLWLSGVLILLGICLLFTLSFAEKRKYRFTIYGISIFLIPVVIVFTYNWQLNPEPEKLLFIGQLVILWLSLRLIFLHYPLLIEVIILLVIVTGLIEAIWGIQQLYGYRASTHHLFRLTGSFINPGPYSGYLAIILPLCLNVLLMADRKRKDLNTDAQDRRFINFIHRLLPSGISMFHILYYFSWICIIIILMILPAGMSRSAWIAAAIGCMWVYWWESIGWKNTKVIWQKHKRLFLMGSIISLFIVSIAFIGIYSLKKDSADGRLLMWKVTILAIVKQPITGVGLGGFPAAYAKMQSEYFASGKGTETERMVAGCPEYAFNEYLQIALEQGIFGLLFFVGWLSLSLYKGIKNRHYGITGGIVALMVFAFSSYPLQLPSFWILLIFLSAMTLIPEDNNISLTIFPISKPTTPGESADSGVVLLNSKKGIKKHERISSFLVVILILSLSSFFYYQQKGIKNAYEKWNKAKTVYQANAYEAAFPLYEELYAHLNHKPAFLFEMGQCLSKMKRYQESNQVLVRATRLSSDPMIHYIIGKNEQMMGHFNKAEQRLKYAIDILPERIYPYFLLTKLYADPLYYQPEKLQIAVDSVLHKKPKVMTTAIQEMREEVKQLLMVND